MKIFLTSALLTLALALGSVHAKEFQLPEKAPVLSIDIPDDWEPDQTDKGIEVYNEDMTIYASIESAGDAAGVDGLIARMRDTLKEQGKKIDGLPITKRETTVAGIKVNEITYESQDEAGPVKIIATTLQVGDVYFVIAVAVSKDADSDDRELVLKMLNSIAVLKGKK